MTDSTTYMRMRYPKRMPMTLAERLVSHYNTSTIDDLRNAVPHFWASMTVETEPFLTYYALVQKKEAQRV